MLVDIWMPESSTFLVAGGMSNVVADNESGEEILQVANPKP